MLPANVKVKAISAGCYSGYVLTTTGQVYAWGINSSGELGIGTMSPGSNVPMLVHLPANPGAVAIGSGPGALHAFAISPSKSG
jgi:alpha-tubulin suppressor-like RCC1 family protein